MKISCLAPLLLALLSTSASATSMSQRECSWQNPGANPYQGNIEDAINFYREIPTPVRETLKARITAGQADELVDIGKYSVRSSTGAFYAPAITDMHFGPNLVCSTITRRRWPENMVQKAAMYCEDKYCVIIPFICGNISRIEKTDRLVELPKTPAQPPVYEHGVPAWKPPTEVPEPGSALLLLAGVGGMMFVRKTKKETV
jgi:hypothetical protein